VLASGSPRRRELLVGLGIAPVVRPVDLDESELPGEEPAAYVERLARAKAAARCEPGELVLAADTTVVIGERILGKPRSRAESAAMLAELSGRAHRVLTAIAVAHRPDPGGPARVSCEVVATGVRFTAISQAMRDWYVDTGEGDDKAGGYAVQGCAGLFVESIDGSYSNVVGLPLPRLEALLHRLGSSLLDWISPGAGRRSRAAARAPNAGTSP